MSKNIYVHGDDNGSCSIYRLTEAEYEALLERMDGEDDADVEAAEAELEKAEVELGGEYGYIPDYVATLAQIYNFEYGSN